MRLFLTFFVIFPLVFYGYPLFGGEADRVYVGTSACKSCHAKEYESFVNNSKKYHSFQAVSKRSKDLTKEELRKCYECHTTGYGKPGGFRSESETPDLKYVGCEACHGPGSEHVAAGDPKAIKRNLTVKDCDGCHSKDRVAAFNYRPLIYGGAH